MQQHTTGALPKDCIGLVSRHHLAADVLVVGGGTSGVCAALQAARLGAKVVVVEETPWLGGMLTAAGVSAVDGNHRLPSGLWGEFRQHLYDWYGGPEQVATGWVSNTLFEPHIGAEIFRRLILLEPNIVVVHGYWLTAVLRRGQSVCGASFRNGRAERMIVEAQITVDATEWGDVMAGAGCAYDVGRDARADTGELEAPEKADPYIQDLTYVAILKDYGPGKERGVGRPPGYNEALYFGTCRELGGNEPTVHDCARMLAYGRLPNNKFMINWPIHGNDCYLNVIEMDRTRRLRALTKAKRITLGWIHFVQQHLNWRHLGLADDEFPTSDGLPFIPYNRESRRLRGVVRFTSRDLVDPYDCSRAPLYKTGVAVGDYPLDHHHARCPVKIEEHLPKIPAFTVPYGCLVPQETDGLLVAEKSISVSHIVNGCTRVQPVVMLVGQAAGAAAALCVRNRCQPRQLSIRELQDTLVGQHCYLLPFTDCPPDHAHFAAVQKIGATGLMRGKPVPHGWANEMHFAPDVPLAVDDAAVALRSACTGTEIGCLFESMHIGKVLTRLQCLLILWRAVGRPSPLRHLPSFSDDVSPTEAASALAVAYERGWVVGKWQALHDPITRAELACLLDRALDPFHAQEVEIVPGRSARH
ncbi:MAG: FAD-dependent oxidoreductase [Candidatus Oleimicrobiaceae bacterium]